MTYQETRNRHMQLCHKFALLRFDSLFSDLSRGEFMPLQTIYSNSLQNPEAQGTYVSELASQLKVSSPAGSRMLRSLEKKGYVERFSDENDSRSSLICLTEKGNAVRKKVFDSLCEYFDRVFERMGPEQMEQLLSLWEQIHFIMEDELRVRHRRNVHHTSHQTAAERQTNEPTNERR